MMLCYWGSTPTIAQNGPYNFPITWIGEWTGELVIFSSTGEQQRTQMNLNIQIEGHLECQREKQREKQEEPWNVSQIK